MYYDLTVKTYTDTKSNLYLVLFGNKIFNKLTNKHARLQSTTNSYINEAIGDLIDTH